MDYRHELKFIISFKQAQLLQMRLQKILAIDQFAFDEEYRVTSLYFDDYQNSCLVDKINGLAERTKYRLRVYNLDRKKINWEIKTKKDDLIAKKIQKITFAEYKKIITGEKNLTNNFKLLQPKIIVDYKRLPLTWPAGKVRITFDKDLQMSTSSNDIFAEKEQAYQFVLPAGEVIFEVKYEGFLPEILKQLVSEFHLAQTAVSKYVLCQQLAYSRWQIPRKKICP